MNGNDDTRKGISPDITDEISMSSDVIAAVGIRITRLHEPSYSFISRFPFIKFAENGFRLVVPWYDAGPKDELRISLSSEGRTVDYGRLEHVVLGGCRISMPKELELSEEEFDPFTPICITIDGRKAYTYDPEKTNLMLNSNFVETYTKKDCRYVAISTHHSIWIRKNDGATTAARTHGAVILDVGDGYMRPVMIFDLSRTWKRQPKMPNTVSYLPKFTSSMSKYVKMSWDDDPSGDTEFNRRSIAFNNIPRSFLEAHPPFFGFVGTKPKIMITEIGLVLRLPIMEFMEESEPAISLVQNGTSYLLPKAGFVVTNHKNRFRIHQYVIIEGTGIDPFEPFDIVGCGTNLKRMELTNPAFFRRNGSNMSVPAGEFFMISRMAEDAAVEGTIVLEKADMNGVRISRCIIPAAAFRERMREWHPEFQEIERGDCETPTILEAEAVEPSNPRKNDRPRRLRPGQILDDGAVVASPVPEKRVTDMDLGAAESDDGARRRLVKAVEASGGIWDPSPHPPSRTMTGPKPVLRMTGFGFEVVLVCYEGGEGDGMLVEISQNDRTLVLYPRMPYIVMGGCAMTDRYPIDLRHLGIDPFSEFRITVDGECVFFNTASDVLFFGGDGARIAGPSDNCTVCYRSGNSLVIDGMVVSPGIEVDGAVFTSIKGLRSGMEISIRQIRETVSEDVDVSEGGSDETRTEEADAPAGTGCEEDPPEQASAPEDADESTIKERANATEPPGSGENTECSVTDGKGSSDAADDEPFVCEDADVLTKALELFDRRIDLNDRNPLSFDRTPGAYDGPMFESGRSFIGCAPSLFLSGSSVYLFLPSFWGYVGDEFVLTVREGSSSRVLSRMKTGDDKLITRKLLLDLYNAGLDPLGRFDIAIDETVVYRNRTKEFIMFDAEGRRTDDQRECTEIVISSGNRIMASHIQTETEYRPDGTGFVSLDRDGSDSWFSVQRMETAEGERVMHLPDRGFLKGAPVLMVERGYPLLRIPEYRCMNGDAGMVSIETSSGETVVLGRMESRPKMRASACNPAVFNIEALGDRLLDGFSVTIDSEPIMNVDRSDVLVFDSSGIVDDERTGDLWILFRKDAFRHSERCIEVASIIRDGLSFLRLNVPQDTVLRNEIFPCGKDADHVPSDDVPRPVPPEESPASVQERIMPLEPDEEPADEDDMMADAPSYREPDDMAQLLESIKTAYEETNACDSDRAYSPDYDGGIGFFDDSPRMLLLDGRIVLAVPPFTGPKGFTGEARIISPKRTFDLGILPRESSFNTAATAVDLGALDIPIADGFTLEIDETVAYRMEADGFVLFDDAGARADRTEDAAQVLVGSRKRIEGIGFTVSSRSEICGGTLLGLSIEEEAMLRFRDRASDSPPVSIWKDHSFISEEPAVRQSKGRFMLHLPAYRCLPGESCNVVLETPESAVEAGSLRSRPGLGAAVTYRTDLNLEHLGIDPLDGLKIFIDGREVFSVPPFGLGPEYANGEAAASSDSVSLIRPDVSLGTVMRNETATCDTDAAEDVCDPIPPKENDASLQEQTVSPESEGEPANGDDRSTNAIPSYQEPDDIEYLLEYIRAVYEDAEICASESGYAPDHARGVGFFDGPPRILLLDGRIVLAVPPFTGPEGFVGEARIVSGRRTFDLGVFPRESSFNTAATAVDLCALKVPVTDGFVLEMDGEEAFRADADGFMLFDETGIRVDDPKHAEQVLVGAHKRLEGTGFTVSSRSEICGGTLLGLNLGEEAIIRCGNRRSGLPSVSIWKDHSFPSEEPSLRRSDSGFLLHMPVYRCLPGEPCKVVLETPTCTVEAGSLGSHPGMGAAVTYRTDLDLGLLDMDPLEGLRAFIDGREVFSVQPFDLDSGCEQEEADDEEDGIQDESECEAHIDQSAEEHVEIFQNIARPSVQIGFVEGAPTISCDGESMFILLPPYRGTISDPLEIWLEQGGSHTVPRGLVCRRVGIAKVSDPTAIRLPASFDPLSGITVRIDGRAVLDTEQTDIMFFPAGGGPRRERPRGPSLAVHRKDARVCSKNADVSWTREIGSVTIAAVDVGKGGFYGIDRFADHSSAMLREHSSDDLLRRDGLLESEYREQMERRRRAAERSVRESMPALEDGQFLDEKPSLLFDGDDFVIRIPPMAADPNRGLSLVLFSEGAPVHTARLDGRIMNRMRLTRCREIRLSDVGADPFGDLEILIDGRRLFAKPAEDIIVLDRCYRYTGRLEGEVFIVQKKGALYQRRRIKESSRRIVGGRVFASVSCGEGASITLRDARIVESARGFFKDQSPCIRLEDGRFKLHIPRYRSREGDRLEPTLNDGSRSVPLPPLTSGRYCVTAPAVVDLTAFGFSPLEQFILSIDGNSVFINHPTDRMIFDGDGEMCTSVTGRGYVVVSKNSSVKMLGAGLLSRRDMGAVQVLEMDFSEGGTVDLDRIPLADAKRALRTEGDSQSAEATAAIEFVGTEPCVRLSLVEGYAETRREIPCPAFNRLPLVAVSVEGCEPRECTIRAEDDRGAIIFGPVEVTGGAIQLNTKLYKGPAKVVISFGGSEIGSAFYLIHNRMTAEIPSKAFCTEIDVCRIQMGDREFIRNVFSRRLFKNFGHTYRILFDNTLYMFGIGDSDLELKPLHKEIILSSELHGNLVVSAKLFGDSVPMRKGLYAGALGESIRPISPSRRKGILKVSAEKILEELGDKDSLIVYLVVEGRGSFDLLHIYRELPEETIPEGLAVESDGFRCRMHPVGS